MKKERFSIVRNGLIAPKTYRLVLEGGGSVDGEFVHIAVPGFFLRRPLSICDREAGRLTIVYKVVGEGTKVLSEMQEGTVLEVLTGLGRGFDPDACRSEALLVGGGLGAAPLYLLAKELKAQGKKVTAVLGFNTAAEIVMVREFEDICDTVAVSTLDGSVGVKGFVTDALPAKYSYFYTCGPGPMLKAVYRSTVTSGEFSFEERMGCGFGACMGCSCKTITGYKRICKDGPVLKKEEILWQA